MVVVKQRNGDLKSTYLHAMISRKFNFGVSAKYVTKSVGKISIAHELNLKKNNVKNHNLEFNIGINRYIYIKR